jgi:ABC-type Fe3+-hydroxamate transport system substrate-binding protein
MLFSDQCGRTVELRDTPRRIVSLVPSQTELLYDLGLRDEVCGITRFCIHPEEWFRSKTRVGGTKDVKTALIDELEPDLIIANKEENVKEQIDLLSRKWPVWVSDVNNLDEALLMIREIGRMTDRTKTANELISTISTDFQALKPVNRKPRTAYLIWKDPYMTVGGDTFIHAMMEKCGLENVFGNQTRYPETNPEEIRNSVCEVVLLSSEPYPFREKHIRELHELLPQTKILLTDGELFSWYGSRLRKSPAYFQKLQEMIK